VTLKVKYADFEQITRSRSRPTAVKGAEDLAALVGELLAQVFPPRGPVRLLGVTISNFEEHRQRSPEQMTLPIAF
jgi:DNA polymerase-4